jgi:hypothetical protein
MDNKALKSKIEREVAFYLGGRGGMETVVGPHLKPLGVSFTGGGGSGNWGDGYCSEHYIYTPNGIKKIVLKISVEE